MSYTMLSCLWQLDFIRHHGSYIYLGMFQKQNDVSYLNVLACFSQRSETVAQKDWRPWINRKAVNKTAYPKATRSAHKGSVSQAVITPIFLLHLSQVQKKQFFVPGKDLRSQNIVLMESTELREMLNITTNRFRDAQRSKERSGVNSVLWPISFLGDQHS